MIMEAKKKALELLRKTSTCTMFTDQNEGMTLSKEISKQIVQLHLDEIVIDYYRLMKSDNSNWEGYKEKISDKVNYWQSVRNELYNL